MDVSMFTDVISLPLWSVIAISLAGVVVGMLFLTLAILLLGRSSAGKEAKAVAVKTSEGETNLVRNVKIEFKKRAGEQVDVPEPKPIPEVGSMVKPEPVAAPEKPYKPVPLVRQHYWYYVSGVSGRFATLREALSASGVLVPVDKPLDWKKLPSNTRAKIQRVKVGDEQTVGKQPIDQQPVPVVQPVEAAPDTRATHKRVPDDNAESEQVIRKSIGDGAFVTIKKKGK